MQSFHKYQLVIDSLFKGQLKQKKNKYEEQKQKKAFLSRGMKMDK